MGYFDATYVLTRKNVRLTIRETGSLILTILSPLLAMIVLYLSQISINNGDGFDPTLFENRDPTPVNISAIPRCIVGDKGPCYTIAYVSNGNPTVSDWIDQVARQSNIPQNETREFQNDDELNRFLLNNPNQTQAAYIFDDESLQKIADGNVQFIVQYNETLQPVFPLAVSNYHTEVVVPSMIHNMNKVLMKEASGKDFDINVKTSIFPHPNILQGDGSEQELDAFANYGPLLLYAVFFLTLVLFMYKIVLERERGLRDAMKLAGQYQSQHYISWAIPYFTFNLLVIFIIIACGHIFRFKVFRRTDFGVYFLTLLIFSFSFICWTFFFAALTKKSTAVSSVGFTVFIVGYMIGSAGLVVYFVRPDGSSIVGENVFFLRQLFAILPSTMFIKSFTDMAVFTLSGVRMTFELANDYTDVFPIIECWYWMLGSGAVVLLLAIFLDNVFPGEHGAPLKPWYMFQPQYWGIGNSKIKPDFLKDSDGEQDSDSDADNGIRSGRRTIKSYNPDQEDEDVTMERNAVANGERDSAALVIKNVTRKFKKFVAVNDVSFSVKSNTAFALLGHNGAGKSTLFKMITTSLQPTSGDIHVFGLSVRSNPNALRKLMGVCPQFDIYWDMLTGAEHIEVFSALKDVTGKNRVEEIRERLSDVNLEAKANSYAGEYSGGMQRRLSVALSLTGNPKLIMLDECTSGADPLVRRDLWGAIERAKSGRVVFLITHSIAEAQHLAGHNRIGIMAKGKLRVLGNAMHLKAKFGAGYRMIVMVPTMEDASLVGGAMQTACPGTVWLSSKNGNNGEILAEFMLPRTASESQVLQVVEIVETRKEQYKIMDSSINSATLDEVFRTITSLSEDVHENENENEDTRKCFNLRRRK